MANPIKVIGIGPGSPDYLLPAAVTAVAQCQVLVGSPRAMALFDIQDKEIHSLNGNLEAALQFLRNRDRSKTVGVLVSGDPGFYSLLSYLRRNLEEELEVIPGLSSLQVAFARLGLPWQDACLLSLHGRPLATLLPYLEERKPMGLLIDSRMKAGELAKLMGAYGSFRVHICRNLTYPEETIRTLTPEQLAEESNLGNAVVVIIPDD
ncbi:MAG: precorrin-6y C5,15-methyltransferase (decarboxylating) subunit CbiE [Clostridia bacterium]|jgi:cobalt-precorrin-7 (C5)-methyltransferase|nr:precorrin-6y C5,15-methyltransferase (decarboxylating) subunit CbiE [Clostridia bacterium]